MKMRAVLLYGQEDLREVEVDVPKVGPDDVLIKIKACGVCPTDARKYYTLSGILPQLPFNLGHEWSGEIVEVGENITEFKPGMRVVGTEFGGYAEYILMSKSNTRRWWTLTRIPDGVTYEEATFTEPLADCIHSLIDQARVRIGEWVLIVGAGQMGLLHVMVAKHIGAKVIISDVVEERLEYAKKFGADVVMNPMKDDVRKIVSDVTKNKGADAVILTAVNQSAIDQALDSIGKRSRIVLFAGVEKGKKFTIDTNIIHYNEVMIIGSEWVGIDPPNYKLYELALELIASRVAPVKELITHRAKFTAEEIRKCFEMIRSLKTLKSIIIFD
jgi:L-iditol 2-dehydrogenase